MSADRIAVAPATLYASRFEFTKRNSCQFVGLLLAFSAYAAALIWRSSFIVDGTRYFCLLDDDMISMRYAANLAHGHGLVWNPGGPPVEGYTNLLWTLYMALFHLLPIDASKISVAIQITGAILLLINLIFVRKIALIVASNSEPVALAAVALTAFYFPLDNWALRGSEVAVLTPISTAAAWMTLQCLQRSRYRRSLYLLLGGATLVRFDMAVLAGAIMLWIALTERESLSVRIRHLLLGGSVLAIFLCLQVAFQLHYYGQPLPNTYYLKLTGYPLAPRLVRGFLVAVAFFGESAALLLVIFYSGVLRRLKPATALLVYLIAAQVLYSIWVGGDAWESWLGSNRYISIVMPLAMVLAAYSLQLWLRLRRMAQTASRQRTPFPLNRDRAMLVNVLFLILAVNAPKLNRFLLLSPPVETDDNRILIEQALLVRKVTRPDAKLAVVWAGIVPYFADRPAIDLLGKNDPTIAHEPMHVEPGLRRWVTFYPGHMKWDYSYSIGQLKPDVVLQEWQLPRGQPDLVRDYELIRFAGLAYYVYARKGSPHVLWDSGHESRISEHP